MIENIVEKLHEESAIKEIDIGGMRDVLNQETVSSVVNRWKRKLGWEKGPFLQFFVACPDDKLNLIVDYICKQLQIEKTVFLELDENTLFYTKVEDLYQEISQLPNSKILILVRGFAESFASVDRVNDSRRAHDYNQDIGEKKRSNSTYNLYKDMGKKLVFITHINPNNEELYERAVKSAAGSQFKDDIIEVR